MNNKKVLNTILIDEQYKNLIIDKNGQVDLNILKPLVAQKESNAKEKWGCDSNAINLESSDTLTVKDGKCKIHFYTMECEPFKWFEELCNRGIDSKMEVYENNPVGLHKSIEYLSKDKEMKIQMFNNAYENNNEEEMEHPSELSEEEMRHPSEYNEEEMER